MQRIKELLKPKIILLSFGISLLLSLCGTFVFPEIFKAGIDQKSLIPPAVGLLLILLTYLLTILLLSFLFINTANDGRNPFTYFKGFLLLLLVEFIDLLMVSALYGLLAVLIQAVLKQTLTTEEIKGVVNITTNILTLLIIPVYIHILMVFGTWEKKLIGSISKGFQNLKKYYFRILLILIILFSIGLLSGIPFRYLQPTLLLNIIETIISTLIGGFGIIGIVAIYPKNPSIRQKKNFAFESLAQQPESKKEVKEPVNV